MRSVHLPYLNVINITFKYLNQELSKDSRDRTKVKVYMRSVHLPYLNVIIITFKYLNQEPIKRFSRKTKKK